MKRVSEIDLQGQMNRGRITQEELDMIIATPQK